MTRTTTGHPARAFRGGLLLLLAWLAYRAPAIEHDFDAAVTAALGGAPIASRNRAFPGPTSVSSPSHTILATAGPRPALVPAFAGQRLATGVTTPPGQPRFDAIASPSADPDDGFDEATGSAVPDLPSTPVSAPAVVAKLDPGEFAGQAYARLAAGDRRGAARLFAVALAGGEDGRAAAWRVQRAVLVRRWSGSAYSIVRARGEVDLAATPVLGGGQSGAALAWAIDPLARHPFALTARATGAHDDGGRSALAAAGVAWHPLPGVTVAAERLVALGPGARGDWTARIAGGAAAERRGIDGAAYGEAGIVGSTTYAAAQAHLGSVRHFGGVTFGPGIGAWASVQHGSGKTVDRVDLGPGVTARAGPFALAADFRFRIAGTAAPGSGPVLTLTAAF